MKKTIGNFLKIRSIQIIIYISLLFMYTADSTTALVIYFIIIHLWVLLLIVGLYDLETQQIHDFSIKNALFDLVEAVVIITILIILEHWYTICITCFCIFLRFVYTFDTGKAYYKRRRGHKP